MLMPIRPILMCSARPMTRNSWVENFTLTSPQDLLGVHIRSKSSLIDTCLRIRVVESTQETLKDMVFTVQNFKPKESFEWVCQINLGILIRGLVGIELHLKPASSDHFRSGSFWHLHIGFIFEPQMFFFLRIFQGSVVRASVLCSDLQCSSTTILTLFLY